MQKICQRSVAGIVLLVSICSAWAMFNQPLAAQNPPNTPSDAQPSACESPQTQTEINRCIRASATQTDREINQIYEALQQKLSGGDRQQLLIDSQSLWQQYRDLNCEFTRSGYEGGSIATTVYYSCIVRMNKQRIEELRDL